MDVAIIDYGLGNVESLQKALKHIGKTCIITKDKEQIYKSSHIFLPGVGSFAAGMDNLNSNNLTEVLQQEVIERKKPFFGICLGMQLLAQKGHEGGEVDGLGWIDAEVIKIKTVGLKIPHMGWNNIIECKSILSPFENKDFYFVHSFHMKMKNENMVVSKVEYGDILTSAIKRDNIFATQFHPEKSQKAGLELLESYFQFYD